MKNYLRILRGGKPGFKFSKGLLFILLTYIYYTIYSSYYYIIAVLKTSVNSKPVDKVSDNK